MTTPAQIIADRMRRLLATDETIYNRFQSIASQSPFDRLRIDRLLFQAEWEVGLVTQAEMWQYIYSLLVHDTLHHLNVRRGSYRLTLEEDRTNTAEVRVWDGGVPVARLVLAHRQRDIWRVIAAEVDFNNLIRKVEEGGPCPVSLALKSQQKGFKRYRSAWQMKYMGY